MTLAIAHVRLTKAQQAALDALPNERQRRFVVAYVGEAMGNGTKAARLAGYEGDDATLGVQASRLLKDARIQAALELLRQPKRDRRVMRLRERQRLLTRIARGEEGDTYATKLGPAPGPPSLRRRMDAVEIMNKVDGVYVQKHEVSVDNLPTNRAELRARLEEMVRMEGGEVTWRDEPMQLTEGSDGEQE